MCASLAASVQSLLRFSDGDGDGDGDEGPAVTTTVTQAVPTHAEDRGDVKEQEPEEEEHKTGNTTTATVAMPFPAGSPMSYSSRRPWRVPRLTRSLNARTLRPCGCTVYECATKTRPSRRPRIPRVPTVEQASTSKTLPFSALTANERYLAGRSTVVWVRCGSEPT
jgi:hypothetical protein